VVGTVSQAGTAVISPAPATGSQQAVADPLAGLAVPGITGSATSVVLTSGSLTINPGIYSQIKLSGTASLTLNPGIYVIAGGGLSVTNTASIAGAGVMIYNANTAYPAAGGTNGGIALTSTGTVNLSAPTTGVYAGILVFQARANASTISITSSAKVTLSGAVYAANAVLAISGSGQILGALDVTKLQIGGSAVANTLPTDLGNGSVAYSPAQVRAAYGISNVALDGTGQTIAIVDAYDNPDIMASLDAFDSQFGLTSGGPTLYQQYGPAWSFLTVVNQGGQTTALPATDPSGAGAANWELEAALDVEWIHAMAPGAQIVLVEANSQSLSDLMAGVATAAAQPGVSVVSMSWGFAEGQQVFADDEAKYDSSFKVPGVTFVASTGDYGAADPEYPAYSPNVVSVGGTSLTLNGDNSYNSETGWGYQSASVGAFIGSGGGLSQYEPEPAYQQAVQSTGSRTTPDVSLVADPATGAWIADTYNLDPGNPFEAAGGTSLSAPAWAALLALVNQGSAAAGGAALNSTSPTETQQALYSLPRNDYNAIASGTNGYSAESGYNLVTGLGTPVANLLVSDLISYQSGTFVASGPTVGGLQDANLVDTGTSFSGIIDVFSVFNSLTMTGGVLANGVDFVPGHRLSSPGDEPQATVVAKRPQPHVHVIPPAAMFAPPSSSIGLMALDFVLVDAGTTAEETAPGFTPIGGRRQVVQTAGPPAIDPAAVDVLLQEGLNVRTRQIAADRPGQPWKWSL
jgi:subtilase family serine protease